MFAQIHRSKLIVSNKFTINLFEFLTKEKLYEKKNPFLILLIFSWKETIYGVKSIVKLEKLTITVSLGSHVAEKSQHKWVRYMSTSLCFVDKCCPGLGFAERCDHSPTLSIDQVVL